VTELTTTLTVTVRYFGAAQAAAGVECEMVAVEPGTTVADVASRIADGNPRLAAVLTRCTYLCDGVAVRNASSEVRAGQTIDALPPFAGG